MQTLNKRSYLTYLKVKYLFNTPAEEGAQLEQMNVQRDG